MVSSIEQLKTTLSGLPLEQRAELAEYLLDSLETDAATAKTEWLALVKERMAEVRAGRIVGIPAADVLRSLPGAKA